VDLPGTGFDDLCVLAMTAVPDRAGPGADASGGVAPAAGRTPGLPDAVYENDGQLTRRELRALALAVLRPGPAQVLWDVGAGSGSVGIEWMRADPLARAVAIEAMPGRAARISRNAARLGVPGLQVVTGTAPGALAGLPPPDAVFIGGGLTDGGVLETCWRQLRPGGRLVAHAVTLESEALLHRWQQSEGGQLAKVAVSYAEPLGGFTAWRPARPVTQWQVTRP
jgi:precorrin-6Y C5,15-methyltransferase (decarboxylating)